MLLKSFLGEFTMGWNKYGARKTTIDGISFPSRLEADVYCHLLMLQKAGEIDGLQMQPSVRLSKAAISYKADFLYYTPELIMVHVEAKGMEGDRWRMIKKLWRAYGCGPLHIYKANKRGVYLDEEIIPIVE